MWHLNAFHRSLHLIFFFFFLGCGRVVEVETDGEGFKINICGFSFPMSCCMYDSPPKPSEFCASRLISFSKCHPNPPAFLRRHDCCTLEEPTCESASLNLNMSRGGYNLFLTDINMHRFSCRDKMLRITKNHVALLSCEPESNDKLSI